MQGGAYTRDATFSFAITPSLDREMFSGSVDAGFVLVLPFHHGELELDCVGIRRGERGAYAWDKIPLQDFVLKMQGGRISGTLW